MTVSASGLGSHGPASVSPERLLSFSRSRISGGAASSAGGTDSTRYRFRINPDRLTTRHDVLEKYTLTQFGYERQDWGNGLSIFQYSGNTGVFRPDVSATEYGQRFPNGFDIRQTKAWQAFQAFEVFYRSSRGTNLFMYYDAYDHEWEGSLSGFSFERSSQSPFHITYSFTFTGMPFDYPSASVSVVSDSSASAAEQRLLASQSSALGL